MKQGRPEDTWSDKQKKKQCYMSNTNAILHKYGQNFGDI